MHCKVNDRNIEFIHNDDGYAYNTKKIVAAKHITGSVDFTAQAAETRIYMFISEGE